MGWKADCGRLGGHHRHRAVSRETGQIGGLQEQYEGEDRVQYLDYGSPLVVVVPFEPSPLLRDVLAGQRTWLGDPNSIPSEETMCLKFRMRMPCIFRLTNWSCSSSRTCSLFNQSPHTHSAHQKHDLIVHSLK